MRKNSTKRTLPGFTCLAPSIYIQDKQSQSPFKTTTTTTTPPKPASLSSSSSGSSTCMSLNSTGAGAGDPDMILITSWTGALLKHVAKYTKQYSTMYPNSPIMVITTSIDDLAFKSTEQKVTSLIPAIGFIQGRIAGKPDSANILLHAFSEGGSNKAVCVARSFLAATGRKMPIGASILDSTPGTPRFGSNVAAFKRSLPPNPVLKVLGLVIGFVVLSLTWVLFCLFVGYENNAISKTRRALNDVRLWPLAGVPRTYMFSEKDDLIHWKDVEDHAEQSAKQYGVTSLVVRYKKSGHCNHVKENEHYYWNAVRQTWESRDVEFGQLGVGMMNHQNLI